MIEQTLSTHNPLLEDLWAFAKTETLLATFELGLFAAIVQTETPQTVQDLANQLQVDPYGLKRLLSLLQTWGYVTLNSDKTTVVPTPQTIELLGSETQKSGWLAYATYIRQVQAAWGGLTSTLQHGTPTGSAFSLSEAEARFSHLNEGLRLLHEPLATALFSVLATYLPAGTAEPSLHCVDIGAGSGVWSLPFLKAYPQGSVTFLDYPSVLAQAENSSALAPFKSRMRLISCDFESSSLEWQIETIAPAQVVLIANVLRELSHEAQINLLKKAWQQVEQNGIIVIVEALATDASEPAMPLVSTVADLHLLATSFNSTGCLTKKSLTQLCETPFEHSGGVIDFNWLDLNSFKQQGLFACVIQK